mmetsp:Transcript_23892/g.38112  ORF Transcript_23892/g.38112 Transcript_23892/m.38112 type:complete len:170 (+) Transcript_23892:1359-1868(+)
MVSYVSNYLKQIRVMVDHVFLDSYYFLRGQAWDAAENRVTRIPMRLKERWIATVDVVEQGILMAFVVANVPMALALNHKVCVYYQGYTLVQIVVVVLSIIQTLSAVICFVISIRAFMHYPALFRHGVPVAPGQQRAELQLQQLDNQAGSGKHATAHNTSDEFFYWSFET